MLTPPEELNISKYFFIITSLIVFASSTAISQASVFSILSGKTGIPEQQLVTLTHIPKKETSIFWFYQNPPIDRLATFWSAFLTNPTSDEIVFSPIAAWAYGQTSQNTDLCAAIKMQPGLNVYTKFPDTIATVVNESCPELSENYQVRF